MSERPPKFEQVFVQDANTCSNDRTFILDQNTETLIISLFKCIILAVQA